MFACSQIGRPKSCYTPGPLHPSAPDAHIASVSRDRSDDRHPIRPPPVTPAQDRVALAGDTDYRCYRHPLQSQVPHFRLSSRNISADFRQRHRHQPEAQVAATVEPFRVSIVASDFRGRPCLRVGSYRRTISSRKISTRTA
jgi:hypothetical protein